MSSARQHESQQSGIILKKTAYGDADEILTVLFADGQVARLFAPKAKKSKKRFGNSLDLFTELQFFYVPKLDGLWRLHQIQTSERSIHHGQDHLEVYGFYHYLSELIVDLVAEFDVHLELFDLWSDLNFKLKSQNLELSQMIQILLHVFRALGYEPQLNECSVCQGRHYQSGVLFDSIRGAVRCCFRVIGNGDQNDVLPWQSLIDLSQGQAISEEPWQRVFLQNLIRFSESIRQKKSLSGDFLMTVL